MKYTGEKCSACENIFEADDDVVVCPDCGAPHHRECYMAEKRCACAEKHAEGYKWQPAAKVPKVQIRSTLPICCPHCKSMMEPSNTRCPNCGRPLSDEEIATATARQAKEFRKLFGVDHRSRFDGIPVEDILIFIKTNILYYFPQFRRFSQGVKCFSFNLLCFIFPPMYFANRRMWSWAILTAVLSVLLAIPLTVMYLVQQPADGTASVFFSASVLSALIDNEDILLKAVEVCNIADFVMRMFLALTCNRLYYSFVIRSIRQLRLQKKGEQPTPYEIQSIGGVRPLNTIIVIAITFIITFAAMFFVQPIIQLIINN